ncbi:hypothetical protein HPB52_000925 [Rhipicephalus sanguineus]|uniref:THAP-type domain-containing protein n=1 Tax=Rhipicephalus sanguineus TaxID=34632 RepID=A0A9D4SX75_RHISA|nr:hypothetical protein HPB52_000925 [Rhipicephalus sanguineus]
MGKKIQVFSFPKDGDALNKWLRAIPRKDFVPTSCTKVCAGHFDAFMRREDTQIQGQGELSKSHCQYRGCVLDLCQWHFPAARPIFRYQTTARETPDAKRSRQEASKLAHALQEWRHTKRNNKVFRPSNN